MPRTFPEAQAFVAREYDQERTAKELFDLNVLEPSDRALASKD
jgi:hypothetical protein